MLLSTAATTAAAPPSVTWLTHALLLPFSFSLLLPSSFFTRSVPESEAAASSSSYPPPSFLVAVLLLLLLFLFITISLRFVLYFLLWHSFPVLHSWSLLFSPVLSTQPPLAIFSWTNRIKIKTSS
jgi:hypothetical protein